MVGSALALITGLVAGAPAPAVAAEPQSVAAVQRTRAAPSDDFRHDDRGAGDHDPALAGALSGPRSGQARLTVLNVNDFHGRIAATKPNTVAYFGTIEQQRARAGDANTLLLAAGDSIGGSLFASLVQQDKPTIDVLNAAGLDASAVGHHEFDRGFADLTRRVIPAARFPYLGANVYRKGSKVPALPAYTLIKRAGLTIGVIGAVTKATPSLVSPGGVAGLSFGDPVAAVNRVARQLTDGRKRNGEADLLIAEYHEGAPTGQPDSTLAQQVAASPVFRRIVEGTSARVAAIFTGHTHQAYAWDGPVPGHAGRTRPIMQSGSYATLLGRVTLTVDRRTKRVVRYERTNLPVTTASNADLIAAYPRVRQISALVTAALAEADRIGGQVIGSTTGAITRAFDGTQEDRGAESTIGNLVANVYRDSLSDPARGGAQIGIQNPGGNRGDLDPGDVTYAEANSVLPFANSLFTLDLTGRQVKELLEQQWQPREASRSYLQLGLSDNVSYTFDAARPVGERITSVSVDGQPLDPMKTYRIATSSFLATGGDNFTVFTEGTHQRDSGLVDLEAWIDYIKARSPLSPSFQKRAVSVVPLPTTLAAGQTTGFVVSNLDFTSRDPTKTTQLTATLAGTLVSTFAVTDGTARVSLSVPDDAARGPATLVLSTDTQTTVRIPVTIV